MEIIQLKDIKIGKWSGGTTSELYIYPKTSNYKDINFLFRLSKATIEVQESTFTTLPNVNRKLMVLDGQLELIHKNQHSKTLKPFEFDTFKGDWQTKSIGLATDFNLMMRGNTTGNYSVIKSNSIQNHSYKINSDFTIFYVANGQLNIESNHVEKGELLIFEGRETDTFKFSTPANTNIIVIRIRL